MELENIMLSEISQSQKVRNQMFFPNILTPGRKSDIGGTLVQRGKTLNE